MKWHISLRNVFDFQSNFEDFQTGLPVKKQK